MNQLIDFAARNMPPPDVVGLPVRLCPQPLQQAVLSRVLNHLMQALADNGEFDYLEGKTLAVEVTDMKLRWVMTATSGHLVAVENDRPADSVIRGRAVEFLLLAGRLEDPDTLFFQRRLEVCGDTVIGLTTRNLLDRLPLEAQPLPARIMLNRVARFGRRVRECRGKPERQEVKG